MKLLNSGNAKTRKGEKMGYITYGIHLAPYTLSGIINVCPKASKGCAAACLNTAGRGSQKSVQTARINKTKFFAQDREGFKNQLRKEVVSAVKSAKRKGMKPCFRFNLTSDIAWEHIYPEIFAEFPDCDFYDYTKISKRMENYLQGKLPKNYHLTFSRSECNDNLVQKVLNLGGNVAVVFAVSKKKDLPASWKGYKVVDGDDTDLRFLDPDNVIVGLRHKGKAIGDTSGFVVEV